MIDGYVVNNSGRFRHIFKTNVSPGMRIQLEALYVMYKDRYEGNFDLKFLEWLQQTKVPEGCGFDIVVNSVDESKPVENKTAIVMAAPASEEEEPFVQGKMPIGKITARQIAGLKTKDNPKSIIGEVSSIHKLRRALTMTKDRAGKETLTRYIRDRISELQSAGVYE
jgi:pyocin large subunit-like protein